MDRYLDTYTIRRRRLRELIRKYERETGSGQAEIARRAGMKPQHISAYKTGHKPRNMGAQAARQIEAGCGLPVGWMDSLDEAQGALDMVERVLGQIPPEHWNPLTRDLVVKIAAIALQEAWDDSTLQEKVAEYLRLVG